MKYNFKITTIDKYIIKKFIGTYLFAIVLIIGIVIIFDISEKIDDFVDRSAPLKEIVLDYYANFVPYYMNMFSPMFVFIAVIFFTSKLAANYLLDMLLQNSQYALRFCHCSLQSSAQSVCNSACQ